MAQAQGRSSPFSLADLEVLPRATASRCERCSKNLHAAGLEMVAEAPFDRPQDPRRSVEEVNISGRSRA
jgi:hypothetical protein